MTVRQITQRNGSPKLGTLANAFKTPSSKRSEIARIDVYPSDTDCKVVVDLFVVNRTNGPSLRLNSNACIELVKGILQNLPDVCIAADDELRSILTQAIARSDADAKAVVDCVMERRTT